MFIDRSYAMKSIDVHWKKTPTATNEIFALSPIPSQIIIKGINAKWETLRIIWIELLKKRCANIDMPLIPPNTSLMSHRLIVRR